jgi:beta-glucanase (GH16 family)
MDSVYLVKFFELQLMKHVFSLTLFLFVASVSVFAQADTLLKNPVPCPEGEWTLVFADEFEGNRLNRELWVTWFPYTDDGSDQCAFCRTHGNEGQVYQDENVVVSGGSLKLIARRETANWMGEQREYTSGMIHSRQSFGLGMYEIRCRLPKGMGFWPAIWAYGRTVTELDILEAGMQHPRRYHMSVHNRQVKKMLHRRKHVCKDLSANFHTYTMAWDSAFIRFEIDSNLVWQISPLTRKTGCRIKRCPVKPGKYRTEPIFPPPSETVHLILNLCIGNEFTPFTKSPDEKTIFPNQMEIDWIRYYQQR